MVAYLCLIHGYYINITHIDTYSVFIRIKLHFFSLNLHFHIKHTVDVIMVAYLCLVLAYYINIIRGSSVCHYKKLFEKQASPAVDLSTVRANRETLRDIKGY